MQTAQYADSRGQIIARFCSMAEQEYCVLHICFCPVRQTHIFVPEAKLCVASAQSDIV